MPSPDSEPFLIFTRKLNELGLQYIVSGSVAAIFYGEPRLTNDVDIIVFLKKADLKALEQAFPPEEFYCPPLEVLQLESSREQRGHFNLIHHNTGFKADIYVGGRDELHGWGIRNARRITLSEDIVCLAPPEYVIVRKLQFYREGKSQKHLRDIARMLSAMGEDWPRTDLEEMISAHGLAAEWSAVSGHID